MRCVVCGVPVAQHACKFCRAVFCSRKCCSLHDNVQPALDEGVTNPILLQHMCPVQLQKDHFPGPLARSNFCPEPPSSKRRTETGSTLHDNDTLSSASQWSRSTAGAATAPPPPPPPPSTTQRPQPVGNSSASVVAHSKDVLLGPREVDSLYNNRRIRLALQSPQLQSMLRTIDQSASKLEALEAAKANDPVFRSFCDEVLHVVWAARAQGLGGRLGPLRCFTRYRFSFDGRSSGVLWGAVN
eukprot:gene11896-8180_t